MILLLDNYDSFTYNLYQYLGDFTQDIKVVRNDICTVSDIWDMNPSHIILSPGPKRPAEAGILEDIMREATGEIPILGICLGHQGLGEVYGGKIVQAPYMAHGKTCHIGIDTRNPLFKGLPERITVGRYHSLVVEKDSYSEALTSIGESDDHIVMALAHKTKPLFGIQFHPESILTPLGKEILANFLAIKGIQR